MALSPIIVPGMDFVEAIVSACKLENFSPDSKRFCLPKYSIPWLPAITNGKDNSLVLTIASTPRTKGVFCAKVVP